MAFQSAGWRDDPLAAWKACQRAADWAYPWAGLTALHWVGLKANLKAACSAVQRASPKAVHLEHRKAESRGDQWAVSKVCR